MNRALIPAEIGHKSLFSPTEVPDGTLVVFVHGFRGRALKTWLYFDEFVDDYEGLRQSDILFYGYDSRARVQNLGINFRLDMDAVWVDPCGSLGLVASDLLAHRLRSRTHVWERMYFVAHSLGAVVARRALIDCLMIANIAACGTHWCRRSGLFLFAPAHSGANVVSLLKEIAGPLGLGVVVPVLKHIYPCLKDLEEGSATLNALKADYKELTLAQRALVKAIGVVLAEKDRVVEPLRFPGDPVADQIRGRGHVDVCKPDMRFRDPVARVSGIYRMWAQRQEER